MTSPFERPAAVRDLPPKPAPKVIEDPWHLVRHPTIPGILTYFRDRQDAEDRAYALMLRYGERLVNGKTAPRVETVDGLPEPV